MFNIFYLLSSWKGVRLTFLALTKKSEQIKTVVAYYVTLAEMAVQQIVLLC